MPLRNRLIENMYFVQEGGAIVRAWAYQGITTPAGSQADRNRLNNEYLDRLAPTYRVIAARYSEVLFRVLSQNLDAVSTILFGYANDALGMFVMNALALGTTREVSFSVDDSVLLLDEVAPDARFQMLYESLKQSSFVEHFRSEAQRRLKDEFGCEDFSVHSDSHLMEAAGSDPEHFEHRIMNALHRGFEAAMPGFAVTLERYEAYSLMMHWRKSLNDWFSSVVTGYTPQNVLFVLDTASKDEVWDKNTKYFP